MYVQKNKPQKSLLKTTYSENLFTSFSTVQYSKSLLVYVRDSRSMTNMNETRENLASIRESHQVDSRRVTKVDETMGFFFIIPGNIILTCVKIDFFSKTKPSQTFYILSTL